MGTLPAQRSHRERPRSPKGQSEAATQAQKRVVHPIKAEFELQYTLVESVEEAKALVALYEKYADFPEVVERVLAGEDEEFVLIDLGLFQDYREYT